MPLILLMTNSGLEVANVKCQNSYSIGDRVKKNPRTIMALETLDTRLDQRLPDTL